MSILVVLESLVHEIRKVENLLRYCMFPSHHPGNYEKFIIANPKWQSGVFPKEDQSLSFTKAIVEYKITGKMERVFQGLISIGPVSSAQECSSEEENDVIHMAIL